MSSSPFQKQSFQHTQGKHEGRKHMKFYAQGPLVFALWYGHDLTISSPPQHGTSAQIQNIQPTSSRSRRCNFTILVCWWLMIPAHMYVFLVTTFIFEEFRVFAYQFYNLQPALSRGDHIILHPSSSRYFGQNHVNIQLPLQVHDATRWHFQRNQARCAKRRSLWFCFPHRMCCLWW